MTIGAGTDGDGAASPWPLAAADRLAVAVECSPKDAELIADLLFAAGAGAVAELDGHHEGRMETLQGSGPEPPGGAVDGAAGDVVTLVADLSPDELQHVVSRQPRLSCRVIEPEAAWDRGWRDHARSWICADRVLLRPAWLAAPPGSGGLIDILIEPSTPADPRDVSGSRTAFGTGSHPTTRLCVEALVSLLDGPRRHVGGARVLDVGCGSGVLSVAAARLGAGAVTAIDIDPVAVEVTADMASSNGVSDRIAVSSEPLADLDGPFDVVVANLLAPIVEALAVDLVRVLAPDATLVVSGVLVDQVDRVIEALDELHLVHRDESHGWVSLVFAQ